MIICMYYIRNINKFFVVVVVVVVVVEYNKVEIELRVVQFWTEIKLVITNRTPASRSCDFVITRLISVQIALHSVQLPL